MDRPIVSVIIPVYNMEKYLEKAVDSICSQTLIDWEMFLVDDGSTDRSQFICNNLAEDDSRIKVIHQENKGAGAARNAAIEKATGKYLYFMDADDWTQSDMLYDMVCLAENYYLDAWAGVPVNNSGRRLASIGMCLRDPSNLKADVPEENCAQMVIAGYYIETYYSDSEYYIQKQCVSPKVYADKLEFRDKAHVLFDKNLLYTPWNKLYLASYVKENHITFPDGHWDDFPFNLDVIRNIERVSVTDKAYYHFIRSRADSESEKYNISLYDEREAENARLVEIYKEWSIELREQMLKEMEEAKEEKLLTAASGEQQSETFEIEAAKPEETEPEAGINIPSAEATEFLSRRYLERLIGCVENVTSSNCELNRKEKRKEIKQMINGENVKNALKTAKPRSLYMKTMLLPVRMRSVSLTYLEGKIISKVKTDNKKLFARLKDNR